MRLTIAAVGRLKEGGEAELVLRYVQRASAGRTVSLGPLLIKEIPEGRQAAAVARKADEARRLLHAIGDADVRVVLDVAGRAMSSDAFARLIASKRDEGARSMAFLIGGPDGHGEAALEGANLKLSLGAMTLPHGLARVVLAEQIYRAVTILLGHPYHRA
jgi:23S rRNA (pseudouridine1915-N3)-methyltransferase